MNIEKMTGESLKKEHFSYNGQVSGLITNLLSALGEDPQRSGLARTPERVSRMYDELLAGYRADLSTLVNQALFASDYEEMVLVKDIEFTSLCEHHLLPFYGKVHVAYLPSGTIIGLSKIPRIVEMYARRLQVQERMTTEIASAIEGVLKPRGVAVLVEGAHMCARIRGVKKSGMTMTTRFFSGDFKTDSQLREEFLQMIRVRDFDRARLGRERRG